MTKLFFLQTATDLKSVLSINDVTIIGLLTAIILALGYVVRHLYLKNETMHTEYVKELKEFNTLLLSITRDYDKTSQQLMEMFKNK